MMLTRSFSLTTAWIALVLLSAGVATAQDDLDVWSTFGGDANHDHYVPIVLEPQLFELRWQRGIALIGTDPRIAIGNGRIYVSGSQAPRGPKYLEAISATDGSQLWINPLRSFRTASAPATSLGFVYVAQGDRAVRTFLGATGLERPELTANLIGGPDAAVTPWDLWIHFNTAEFLALSISRSAVTRQEVWRSVVPGPRSWSPAVDEDSVYSYGDTSVDSPENPRLRVLDRRTGAMRYEIAEAPAGREFRVGFYVVLSEHEHAIVRNSRGQLVVFDLAGRRVAWASEETFAWEPAVRDDVIYAVGPEHLIAFDLFTGEELFRWQPESGDLPDEIPLVTDSHIFVTSRDQITYAIDLETLRTTWTFPERGRFAYADGSFYIASSTMLTAFSANEFVRTAPVSLEIESADDLVEGTSMQLRAFVTYESGARVERTIEVDWSLEENDFAALSDDGILEVGEVFVPANPLDITARYVEPGGALETTKTLVIAASIPTENLIRRNLEQARVHRSEIDLHAAEAQARERAAELTLQRIRRGEEDGPPSPSTAKKAGDELRRINLPSKVSRDLNMDSLNQIDRTLRELDAEAGGK